MMRTKEQTSGVYCMIDEEKRAAEKEARARVTRRVRVQIDPDKYRYFPEEEEKDYFDDEVNQRVAIYARVSTGSIISDTINPFPHASGGEEDAIFALLEFRNGISIASRHADHVVVLQPASAQIEDGLKDFIRGEEDAQESHSRLLDQFLSQCT